MTLLQKIREKCIEANPDKACPHSATCKGPRCSVIRLADILLVISQNYSVTFACDATGEFEWRVFLNDNVKIKRTGYYWNLRSDSLEDQSPETLEFIGKVLGV